MARLIYRVGMGTPPKQVDFLYDVDIDVVYGDEFYPYWCCSGCNDYFAYFSTEEKAKKQWESSDMVMAYPEDPKPCHYGNKSHT